MNRVAQRKFRERQKSTVASLQIELDERDAVVQRMSAQLRALEQTNIVSMHESLNVECTAYDDIILLHYDDIILLHSRRYWHQSFSSMSSCTVPFPHAWNCSNDHCMSIQILPEDFNPTAYWLAPLIWCSNLVLTKAWQAAAPFQRNP